MKNPPFSPPVTLSSLPVCSRVKVLDLDSREWVEAIKVNDSELQRLKGRGPLRFLSDSVHLVEVPVTGDPGGSGILNFIRGEPTVPMRFGDVSIGSTLYRRAGSYAVRCEKVSLNEVKDDASCGLLRMRRNEEVQMVVARPADPVDVASRDAEAELRSAAARYGPMRSAHEGFAVLKEEVDELWDEVKKKPSEQSRVRLRREAVQVAAMALRFIVDVCDGGAR